MEAAHGYRNSSDAEWSCDVEGAGVLVRLYTDEGNTPKFAVTPKASKQLRYINTGIRLVNHLDVDRDV